MTLLGKYDLHEQISRGGFGTVYRATDTSLKREVALKVLHPRLTTDPDFLEKFREEARIVAGLESHSIVTIYELGEADGRVLIAPCSIWRADGITSHAEAPGRAVM